MVAVVARRARVPYALALVVTGLVIGVPRLLPQVHLNPHILFTLFLPPLLFESAINLRVAALRRNAVPIAIYALVGTVASAFIVGGLTHWLLHIPLPVALVFGAIVSPTDPISVIAIFKRLDAGKRLTLLIEAESLFNDNTAFVLFTILVGFALGGKISVAAGLGQFARLAVGGALVGGAIGVIASRVHYELDDHLAEITLTTIVAFGSYLCAESLHVSSVMAVITAGIVVGNYGAQRAMSPSTQLAMTAFWEYAAFVVTSVVFLLIGIEVAYVHWASQWRMALAAAVIVLIGRTVIYPLSLVVNVLKGHVPLAWQHILVWGGLRGALSMALALGLSGAFPYRETLVAATFGVVLFSLLVQGLTLGPLLKLLALTGFTKKESAGSAAQRRQIQRQIADVRRAALIAEKSIWQESERRGWLQERKWQDAIARLDAELLALETDMDDSANDVNAVAPADVP